jgi:hypothetical protein
MNGYEALAGALSDLANWSEDELASAVPPKHVAQQVTERARQIAWAATMAGRGRIGPDDLCRWLGRDGEGGGDTLTLGRPRTEPEPSGWRRAWRAVRREVAGLVARKP